MYNGCGNSLALKSHQRFTESSKSCDSAPDGVMKKKQLVVLLLASVLCVSWTLVGFATDGAHKSSTSTLKSRRTSISNGNEGAYPTNSPPQAARNRNVTTRQHGLPHAVIIGVKKGGTRALISMLALHPHIRSASKEVHFFDRDEEYQKGVDYYVSQMPSRKRKEVVVEKTPSYMFSPAVPKRMRETLPKTIKFIVTFRDPVERAISDYMQSLDTQNDNFQTFEKKVITRTGCGRYQKKCVNSGAYLIQVGQYSKWLEQWLSYYNRSHFLFLSGEELTENPVNVLNKVETFLGVRKFFQKDMFYFNKEKGFYCHHLSDKDENSKLSDGCLGRAKGRPHIQVDPQVIMMLRDYYTLWNRKLYQLVGRDFYWDYKEKGNSGNY